MIRNGDPQSHSRNGNDLKRFAAIFIDFENIFYTMKKEFGDIPDLNEYVFHIFRTLRARVELSLGLQPIIMQAYADFERIKSAPQGSLYLMGIETHNVLSPEHKNAADMKLCIDAMEILYTRPEIETFIFLAGDRDYIPILQHLKKQGRTVLTVAFRQNISGDLLLILGERSFIDMITLFEQPMLDRLRAASERVREHQAAERERDEERNRAAEQEELEAKLRSLHIASGTRSALLFDEPGSNHDSLSDQNREEVFELPPASAIAPVVDEIERRCLDLMLKIIGKHHEIWLGPFLRKLSDDLPTIADFERKALINSLESHGAIQLKKRHGEPYDYTVILLNYNHPTVREIYPGL